MVRQKKKGSAFCSFLISAVVLFIAVGQEINFNSSNIYLIIAGILILSIIVAIFSQKKIKSAKSKVTSEKAAKIQNDPKFQEMMQNDKIPNFIKKRVIATATPAIPQNNSISSPMSTTSNNNTVISPNQQMNSIGTINSIKNIIKSNSSKKYGKAPNQLRIPTFCSYCHTQMNDKQLKELIMRGSTLCPYCGKYITKRN
ncbi:MAG: hypothetical protein ACTSVU_02540 [Promethearchaeota archaeon]